MKILLGCEESQAVLVEMRKRGHEAYSCDILPASGPMPEYHLQMDVLEAIDLKPWDMGIFFTPCTFSCNSGIRWMYNADKSINGDRWRQMETDGDIRRYAAQGIKFQYSESGLRESYTAPVRSGSYRQKIRPNNSSVAIRSRRTKGNLFMAERITAACSDKYRGRKGTKNMEDAAWR